MAIRDGWKQIRDIFADKGVHLSPLEAKVLDALLGCERIVPSDDIVEHVYSDHEDGGPLVARHIIKVEICRLRKCLRLVNLPWRIITHHNNGYQLRYTDEEST